MSLLDILRKKNEEKGMATEVLHVTESLEQTCRNLVKKMLDVLYAKPLEAPLAIGLCGGRSVVGLLDALEQELREAPTSFVSRLHFFLVDERLVPLEHSDSNYGALYTQSFAKLIDDQILQKEQLHPFLFDTSALGEACAEYHNQLDRCGGGFSVVILGMGEDGHVASLFPHHPLLSDERDGFVTISDSPKPPPARMTASRRLLEGSSIGILLALGEGKRGAWENFNVPGQSIAECPALVVRSMEQVYIVTDL